MNLTKGRPDVNMTNEQWQEYFFKMKQMVNQGEYEQMTSCAAAISTNGYLINIESENDDTVPYERYCQFINSILCTIRGSESEPPAHDYCFFIYQIADLLRFEHDRLNVIWLQNDKCFEVWLDE